MTNLDYEKIAEKARELAKERAAELWPPDCLKERRSCEAEQYIIIYRQMTKVRK